MHIEKAALTGSLLQEELGTPALALVRAVCDALRLDPSVEEEVLVLRRNLLLLTHTLEFAPAAEFRVCSRGISANVLSPCVPGCLSRGWIGAGLLFL